MPGSDSRAVRDDLYSAFSLLTRLPVPQHGFRGAASAWAWPLVGGVLGVLAAALALLALRLGLPPGPAAALALAALALMTGGLHEDGLADTADGLLGGQTRERRLEIMKDSRIGSHGALALGLVLLAQWSALAILIARPGGWTGLIAAAALSRAAMVAVMAALPPARTGGLSAGAGRPAPQAVAMALLFALLLALACAGWAALPAALAAALAAALLARAALRRIGGQTGDILGASQQLAFAAALSLLA
ncbi:MAG: adenosylcobinamide-GDP ribazoletransferase [Rhodobacteraceae bacterium]|jgi:adenosylcobinamide-GDP ribazoletransferase|nr:adenosylcobinamide-GDP ribazoletransferase [Paracoccaceae bacterium]